MRMANEQTRESEPAASAASWCEVAECNDIPNGQYRKVSFKQNDILIVHLNGEFFAIDSVCSHMNMELMGGRILGDCITCPHHGAQFRIRDGAAAGYPAVHPIATFEIQTEEGKILVRECQPSE